MKSANAVGEEGSLCEYESGSIPLVKYIKRDLALREITNLESHFEESDYSFIPGQSVGTLIVSPENSAYIRYIKGYEINVVQVWNRANVEIKKKSPVLFYLEVLASRLYRYFDSSTFTAETNFYTIENRDIIGVSSEWIADFNPYLRELPYISADRIVFNFEGVETEVLGYLPMLVISRWIGAWDSVGKGANVGYKKNEDGTISNVKIDTGGALEFFEQEGLNPLQGIIMYLMAIISKKHFDEEDNHPFYFTDIPLEMLNIDEDEGIHLSSAFSDINILLEFFSHKNSGAPLDLRDLLIGNIRYVDIQKSEVLSYELGKIIYEILSVNKETLKRLIYEDMPDMIGDTNLAKIKEVIFTSLIQRMHLLKLLYASDLEQYCAINGFAVPETDEISSLFCFDEQESMLDGAIPALDYLIRDVYNLLGKEKDIQETSEYEFKYENFKLAPVDIITKYQEIFLYNPRLENIKFLIKYGAFGLVELIFAHYPENFMYLEKESIESLPEDLRDSIKSYLEKEHEMERNSYEGSESSESSLDFRGFSCMEAEQGSDQELENPFDLRGISRIRDMRYKLSDLDSYVRNKMVMDIYKYIQWLEITVEENIEPLVNDLLSVATTMIGFEVESVSYNVGWWRPNYVPDDGGGGNDGGEYLGFLYPENEGVGGAGAAAVSVTLGNSTNYTNYSS